MMDSIKKKTWVLKYQTFVKPRVPDEYNSRKNGRLMQNVWLYIHK